MAKKKYALLISPAARSAYFSDYLAVAKAELKFILDLEKCKLEQKGELEFLTVSMHEEQLTSALSLSFVMGAFEKTTTGLIPIDQSPHLRLHSDFVFGSKYKGKTNEHLTKLLINLGLGCHKDIERSNIKLLDPMCGRGTTLMWALRYGMNCRGIEREISVLPEVRQHLKKWCKLHRQKHSLKEGFVAKANKKQSGKFIELTLPEKNAAPELKAQIICGDTREADSLLHGEKFHIIASDLPYGIQHTTQDGKRNPIETLNECAYSWKRCLKPNGHIVLAYNKYIPKREAIIDAFTSVGMTHVAFEAPHRMSESIVRDIVIFTH